MTVTPVSAGVALGSSNWVIQLQQEKVVYLADTVSTPSLPKVGAQPVRQGNSASAANPPASAVSTPATLHSSGFDWARLMSPTWLILSRLSVHPLSNPEAMVNHLLTLVGSTVSSGGSVLIPTPPVGKTFSMTARKIFNFFLNTQSF